MLLSMFKYSGLTAKIAVMMGRMLKVQDYEELIKKRSVQDMAAYLKYNTAYKVVLKDVNEKVIHRGQLERICKASLVDDYMKLFRFIRGNVKTFLKFAFLRYEIEDLKILLRALDTEHNTWIVRDSLVFLEKYGTVDIEKLATSKTISEFIQNLKGSVYYDVLSPFITNLQHLNLFSIEMSLDMYFFSLIWKQKEKLLRRQDEKIISHSFGSETDMLNILWIYRCKKFYDIPKEIIYSYVISYRYKLSKEKIIAMVEAKDTDEVKSIIQTTKYAEVFGGKSDHYYEKSFTHYVHKMHKKFLRNNRFSIGSLMAYLHLKEIEIRNIVSIIEGIRYDLPADEIRKYVVM